jgi:hypothetical protein
VSKSSSLIAPLVFTTIVASSARAQLWTNPKTSASPPARSLTALSYDPAKELVLLFGGFDGQGFLDDTWEWDGARWTQSTAPQPSPPARWGHSLAADLDRRKVVLFGGVGTAGLLNDTWEWDGERWAQVSSPTPPSPRWGAAMAFDTHGRTVVLVGGLDDTGAPRDDVWVWSGTGWSPRANATSKPPARFLARLAFADMAQEGLLFGGQTLAGAASDAWTPTVSSSSASWVDLGQPNPSPTARASHQLAGAGGLIILFGGGIEQDRFDDTWEWHPADRHWSRISQPATSPSARTEAGFAYDHKRRRLVLFGGAVGRDAGLASDTWEYESSADPASTPRGGCGCASLGAGVIEIALAVSSACRGRRGSKGATCSRRP